MEQQGLYCTECEKEIGLLGDHLAFLRTNYDTKILHKGECYENAKAKLTEEEYIMEYA